MWTGRRSRALCSLFCIVKLFYNNNNRSETCPRSSSRAHDCPLCLWYIPLPTYNRCTRRRHASSLEFCIITSNTRLSTVHTHTHTRPCAPFRFPYRVVCVRAVHVFRAPDSTFRHRDRTVRHFFRAQKLKNIFFFEFFSEFTTLRSFTVFYRFRSLDVDVSAASFDCLRRRRARTSSSLIFVSPISFKSDATSCNCCSLQVKFLAVFYKPSLMYENTRLLDRIYILPLLVPYIFTSIFSFAHVSLFHFNSDPKWFANTNPCFYSTSSWNLSTIFYVFSSIREICSFSSSFSGVAHWIQISNVLFFLIDSK